MDIQRDILRFPAYLFLIGCIVYTIFNYSKLSYEEGWGVVFMIGTFVVGVSALVVDVIIQLVIKSPKIKFVTRIVALLAYSLFFYFGA